MFNLINLAYGTSLSQINLYYKFVIQLIIVFIFSFLYMYLGGEHFINVIGERKPISYIDYLHHSFVTHTTLGYADLYPITNKARTLSMFHLVCTIFFSLA